MSQLNTIAEAAEQALLSLRKASTALEIHAEIVRLELSKFNTTTPVPVLETEMKRYSSES